MCHDISIRVYNFVCVWFELVAAICRKIWAIYRMHDCIISLWLLSRQVINSEILVFSLKNEILVLKSCMASILLFCTYCLIAIFLVICVILKIAALTNLLILRLVLIVTKLWRIHAMSLAHV